MDQNATRVKALESSMGLIQRDLNELRKRINKTWNQAVDTFEVAVPGGGAPSDAYYITTRVETGLSEERVLTITGGVTGPVDGGAGGNYTWTVHDAVSLADAATQAILGLSTQALSFDVQAAGKVLAGPTTGADAQPTFRNLVGGDFGVQNANVFLAGPVSGSAANPTFRAQVWADFMPVQGATTLEPTGFPNTTETTLSVDTTTGVVTITPTGASFSIYLRGTQYSYTVAQTTAAASDGNNYYYLNASGVLTYSTTPWDIANTAQIAAVYKNSSNPGSYRAVMYEERHGMRMDGQTHRRLHYSIGNTVESGLAVGGYTLATDTDAAKKITVSSGVQDDEDIFFSNAGIAAGGPYIVWYRSGASGTWYWREIAYNANDDTTLPFIIQTASGYLVANTLTGGNWVLTDGATTKWVNYYVVAIPILSPTGFTIGLIPGQTIFSTLSAAQTEEGWASLSLGTLPFQEVSPLAKITFALAASNSSKGKATIVAVSDIRRISSPGTPASAAPDHSALSGRTAANQHPATAIYTDTTNFNAGLSATDTTVQLALETLEDLLPAAPAASKAVRLDGSGNVATHWNPAATDTYDLGTTALWWRKGYVSELDSMVFAENTVSLVGGWLVVSKDQGVLPAAVAAAATTIDFGKAVTSNSFVVFRSAGQVEYIKVLTVSSGTTYNVTRNLDGSGANDWPAGTPFWVRGVSGNGWIELNAYDTPRISIFQQGADYNTTTELYRVGDLNGAWGYSAETYGFAVGEYAASKANMSWDPTNGLRLRTYSTTVIQLDNSGNADISGKLRLPGTGSALAIGATPPTAANSGTGIWIDRTGLYSLEAGVSQVKIDATNGKLYAGKNGSGVDVVQFDDDGITIAAEAGVVAGEIKWRDSTFLGTKIASIYATPGVKSILYVTSPDYIYVKAGDYTLSVLDTGNMLFDGTGYASFAGDGRVGGGIYVGATNVDPGAGNVEYTGDLKALRDGSLRTGYIFVPLSTPATSTDWDGNDTKTPGTYSIDTSASPWSIPAGVKAVLVQVSAQWAAANNSSTLTVRPRGGSTNVMVIRASVASVNVDGMGIIPCDANGDIDIVVSTANAVNTVLRIWGYFL